MNEILKIKNQIHYKNVNSFIKAIMITKISKGNIVIDATIGNGNDITFMMNLIGSEGFAYGFDIQDSAILNTEKRIYENFGNEIKNYKLFKSSHENILNEVKEEVDFVVFNLGYLPKSDHSVITKPESTIKAIEASLNLLKRTGCICIASYIGHDGGMEEYRDVKTFLSSLDEKLYCVSNINYINLINNPPEIFIIEKR